MKLSSKHKLMPLTTGQSGPLRFGVLRLSTDSYLPRLLPEKYITEPQ